MSDCEEMMEPEGPQMETRAQKLGFHPQKELPWNRYLPYADKLDDESQAMLQDIKVNLARAVAMRDIISGAGIYTTRLMVYIKLYGLKFSKEDHIKFIKLYLELISLPNLEPSKLNKFCVMLLLLFPKTYNLAPSDLEIDWRPLYHLSIIYLHKTSTKGNLYQYFAKRQKKVNLSSMFDRLLSLGKSVGATSFLNNFEMDDEEKETFQCSIKSVIQNCSVYFSKSSTKEIIEEVLPKLQPLDTGKSCQVFETLNLFLNFHHGYDLWFDDFMGLWNSYHDPRWSEDMMNIMGNLAFENIGKIDWEPHLPIMFARILRWIDLPVAYKQLKVCRTQGLCAASVTKWIVAVLGPNTSGQQYLAKFIAAIESYLHPANTGKWAKILGQILVGLPENFIKRLEYERFRKPHWRDPIPDHYKLTEECITEFVESLKSAALQTMYSRIDGNEVYKIFRHLSNLRPELIIPNVIERVFANLESLTEPHRLTASLQCLVGVSRALICGHNGYTAGRTHVIPILFAVLPGIDTNDLRKAILTMNFYGAFVFQIPIVDCSKAGMHYDDLTEEESLICEQTADLEDFVLQFMDRLFLMIKYTTNESIRMEQANCDNNKSKYDVIVEHSISTGLQVILGQSSESILVSASKKVTDFVQGNLLEPHAAAPLLGHLVYSVGQIAGGYMFKVLVPYLTDRIMSYIREHEDVANIEKQSDDFLYYLTILYYLYKSDPRQVIKYFDDYFIPVMDEVVKFKCKQTSKITAGIMFRVLNNFSRIQLFDMKSSGYSKNLPLSEYLPIRHWGEKMDPKETFNWYIPGEKERAACEKFTHRYLPPILKTFEKFISGEITLSREDVLKNANFLFSFITIPNFLPNWTVPQEKLIDTVVDTKAINITLGFDDHVVTMPDGSDIRLAVIDIVGRLQDKILADSSDDIQSLKTIILIWECVHMRKSFVSSYESELKSYKHLKEFQEYRLVKYKRNIKTVVAKRILIQQTCREEVSVPAFTVYHKQVMQKLLKLATSHYSAIRLFAQSKLFNLINTYAFCFRVILDDLIEYLKLDPIEQHEAFKGALYMLVGSGRTKLIVRHDWLCVEKLWLTVLKTKPSEKPSIVRLLDTIICVISDEFTTLTIELQVPDHLVSLALQLVDNSEVTIKPQDIEAGKLNLDQNNTVNLARYLKILEQILDVAQGGSLHWRYHLMASTMLNILVHPTTKYPSPVAKYFVQNLHHDSIKERKIATRVLKSIFEQQKRKQVKISMDPFEIAGVPRPKGKLTYGIRDDNRWLQYDEKTLPKSQEDWDKPCYIHKGEGFFGWSADFKLYAPSSQQPKIDRQREEMNGVEQVIYDFFSNKDNVDKFISFWSLEENKGKEKFKQSRFCLIKFLFKTYGDVFFGNFYPHLERLIKENKSESNHRCAAEILSGIMRGMKHWPYDKVDKMYKKITPLIRLALDNITVETDDFWGTCFATASEHVDPKKQYWLHEVLMEDPLRESTSFVDCCRIFCLQGPFNQHVWRMDSFSHRLLKYLKPYLNHPFQNVRIRLGSILINIFEADLTFEGGNPPECPRVKDMIKEVVEQIQPLLKVMPTMQISNGAEGEPSQTVEQKEYEAAVRLFKTISQWIIGVISRNTNGNEAAYFDLLPFVCRLESCEQDQELAESSSTLLAMISQALTLPNCMGYALEKISEVSKSPSWGSRLAVIDALQVLIFHNMAIVSSREEWVQTVQDIVLRLLEDTSLEVREKAAQVLGGLLHCSFLPATGKLLELFKRKCRTKFIRGSASRRNVTTCAAEASRNDGTTVETPESMAIRMRHTGVLGLCAFISAYPYDIPDFVPDVFECLGAHLNDPQPIVSTIRKTVGDFKRTHHDNWSTHQLKFTEDQLAVLSDLTIPPSYYT